MSDLIKRRHERAVELANYLDDLMEHTNAQLVIDMDAEIERLRKSLEYNIEALSKADAMNAKLQAVVDAVMFHKNMMPSSVLKRLPALEDE